MYFNVFFYISDLSGVMVSIGVVAPRVQVLVRKAGIKANSCNESYPSLHIIRNSFSVCALSRVNVPR